MYSKPRTANRSVYDEHWRKWKEKFGTNRNRHKTTQATPPPETKKGNRPAPPPAAEIPPVIDELDELTDDESDDVETSV